jgi:integrase
MLGQVRLHVLPTEAHAPPQSDRGELPAAVRLYDLRHTHATLLLAQTGNLKLVSSQLGHSGITQTANVYAHIQPATQREAAEKLDAILAGESKTPGNN